MRAFYTHFDRDGSRVREHNSIISNFSFLVLFTFFPLGRIRTGESYAVRKVSE